MMAEAERSYPFETPCSSDNRPTESSQVQAGHLFGPVLIVGMSLAIAAVLRLSANDNVADMKQLMVSKKMRSKFLKSKKMAASGARTPNRHSSLTLTIVFPTSSHSARLE